MSNIVLNNNLKMCVGRYSDLLLFKHSPNFVNIADFGENFLPTENIGTLLYKIHSNDRENHNKAVHKLFSLHPDGTLDYIAYKATDTVLINDQDLIKKTTGLAAKFNRKEIRFFDSGGEEVALYIHDFPLLAQEYAVAIRTYFYSTGNRYTDILVPLTFHNDNHMYIDPSDGNLIFTLIPAISIPVHDHIVNKRVTRFEVKVFNVHDKLTMKVDGTVSTPAGSGDIKLSSNFVTQGSSILVNGLDKFKIVVPNELPLNLISEEAVV